MVNKDVMCAFFLDKGEKRNGSDLDLIKPGKGWLKPNPISESGVYLFLVPECSGQRIKNQFNFSKLQTSRDKTQKQALILDLRGGNF